MRNEKLYRKAVEFAADCEGRFLSAHEANLSFEGRALKDRHQQIEVVPAACAACAQQELIAHLFGVSDERVHEDVTRVVRSRRPDRTRLRR